MGNSKELPKYVYSAQEIAKILGVNIGRVHDLRRAGVIKMMKLDSWKCWDGELRRFLDWAAGKDLTGDIQLLIGQPA